MLYFLVILLILFIVFLVCMLIDIQRNNKYKLENELFNNIMCNYINKGDIVRIDGDTVVVNWLGNHWSVFTYYEEYGLSFKTYNIINFNNVTVWVYDQSVLSSKNMKLLKDFVKISKVKQKHDKCLRYKDTLSKIT